MDPHEVTGGPVQFSRLEFGDWSLAGDDNIRWTLPEPPVLPDWAAQPAPAMVFPPGPLSPSGLGAMVHAGEAAEVEPEDALRRGSQLHLLLEHLPLHPPQDWAEAASALLREGEDPAEDGEIADRLDEARLVLAAPGLAHLFGPESLAEVDVTAVLPDLGTRPIHGRIDRLVRRKGGVLAVDYKSNRVVPRDVGEVPDGILMQMGAYHAALREIFPGERVEVAVLWTREARLMPLPDEMVIAALQRATIS